MSRKVITQILIAAMLVTTVFAGVPATVAKAEAKEYYFSNLSYASQWGVSSRSISNGALKATFSSMYGEVKYTFPDAISVSNIQSMTVGANTAGQNTAFKFYDASGKQLFVKYNASCKSYTDFSIATSGSGSIKSIGVMSQSSTSYTATVYNIKFTMKSSSSSSSATLKSAMSGTFGKVGAAIGLDDLKNSTTLSELKKDYNSITLGNEMKPDTILGYNPTTMTVSEAKAKGYIIPDGYGESKVPVLNYSTIDDTLKAAYENGLSVRFHTLLWHRQTPTWFFKYSYNKNYDYCNTYTMDKRVEFYVKNIVAHICTSKYKDVVYAYDVMNEYFHNTDSGVCHWTQIYGEQGTRPTYVKAAFTYANDMLNYYGMRSKVRLFYNDYNTYLIADDIVSLVNYINEGGKKCDGVGMQSHLDVDWPDANFIGKAVDKFKAAGFEIQITELDATINYRKSTYTLQDQATYYASIIKMLKEKKQGGANITGVTFWGMSDDRSWRANGQPLLYSTVGSKKPAYDAIINAMK